MGVPRPPVNLPLHCTSCFEPVMVRYLSDSEDAKTCVYTCPYCLREVTIHLPGQILGVTRDAARR